MHAKPRTLIIDDNLDILEMVECLLEDDFEVLAATTAEMAMVILRESTPFHIIVSDLNMPDMSGLEFLKCLRSEAPHICTTPVILCTGILNQELLTVAKNLGAAEIVSKPFDAAQLLEKMFAYARPQLATAEQVMDLVSRANMRLRPYEVSKRITSVSKLEQPYFYGFNEDGKNFILAIEKNYGAKIYDKNRLKQSGFEGVELYQQHNRRWTYILPVNMPEIDNYQPEEEAAFELDRVE